MNLAIIPARSGSKRLPGKNLRILNGRPMIYWTICAALKSQIFDYVVVSTDCKTTRDVALELGAICSSLRPAHLASDLSSTWDVVKYEVQKLEVELGEAIKAIALLQPTSPLRECADILASHKMLMEGADSVISVSQTDLPKSCLMKLDSNNSLSKLSRRKIDSRSPQNQSVYQLNGAIYWVKRQVLDNIDKLYDGASKAYIMRYDRSVDVDTMEDFELAEFYFQRRHKNDY